MAVIDSDSRNARAEEGGLELSIGQLGFGVLIDQPLTGLCTSEIEAASDTVFDRDRARSTTNGSGEW